MFGNDDVDDDDPLNDWYEKALKAGKGFKSEEEKRNYVKSLGDPMKHPMFATSAEDLANSPYADALRALREEDKSFVEVATMYKEEGNKLLSSKSDSRKVKQAIDQYTSALDALESAKKARSENAPEATAYTSVDLDKLHSQLLSNRAYASYLIKNYGSCLSDATISLHLWNGNTKAFLRKCQALYGLKKYEQCLQLATSKAAIDTSTIQLELDKIVSLCRTQIEVLARLEDEKRRHEQCKKDSWRTVWDDIKRYKPQMTPRALLTFPSYKAREQATSSNIPKAQTLGLSAEIILGYPPFHTQEQLIGVYPNFDRESGCFAFPLLFLYPQYNQLDVVHAANVEDTLVRHLSQMFPAFADVGVHPLPWDRNAEYEVSNLIVYLTINMSPAITDKEEWVNCCYIAETGSIIADGVSGASEGGGCSAKNGSTDHQVEGITLEPVRSREDIKHRLLQHSKNAALIAEKLPIQEKDVDLAYAIKGKVLVDIHLGCTISQVLRIPNNVLCGNVLSLVVYPRDCDARREFLARSRKDRCFLLALNPC